MPLVPDDGHQNVARAPWRGLVAGVVAAVAFIVGLAVVARATRDSAGGVPPRPDEPARLVAVPPPAGPTGEDDGAVDMVVATTDAGQADAGAATVELATVEPEPDSGPVEVPGPPVDVAQVMAEVQPVLEKCLQGALRFDPSLGGNAGLSLSIRKGVLTAAMIDAPSPVLAACVEENARALPTQASPREPVKVEARVALDGLRGRVKVESAVLVLEP